MILVQSIDLSQSLAVFEVASGDLMSARDEFARLAEIAGRLGFRDLYLRLGGKPGRIQELQAYVGQPRGEDIPLGGALMTRAETAVELLPRLEWICGLQDECPFYHLDFDRVPEMQETLDVTLALVLSTYGTQVDDLQSLRIAIFEMFCAIIDNGAPLTKSSDEPFERDLKLQLIFGEEAIEGLIEDGCQPFDPCDNPTLHISPAIANRYEGSGNANFLHTLVDGYEHSITSVGNRLTFHKRIER